MDTNTEPAVPEARWPNLRRSVFLPLAATVVLLLLALGLAALWNEKRSEAARHPTPRSASASYSQFDPNC